MTEQLLRDLDRLGRKTRRSASWTWLPVVLLGIVGLAALPLYVSRPVSDVGPISRSGWQLFVIDAVGGVGTGRPTGIAIVWLIAVPLICVLTSVYAASRASRVGLSIAVMPFLLAAFAAEGALLLAALLARPTVLGSPLARAGLVVYVVAAVALALQAMRERDLWALVLAVAVGALAWVLSLREVGIYIGEQSGLPVQYWPALAAASPALLLIVVGLLMRRRAGRA